jgi:CBS domain containing-hemolysin-like protein
VPASTPAMKLLRQMQTERFSMAMVIDELGATTA